MHCVIYILSELASADTFQLCQLSPYQPVLFICFDFIFKEQSLIYFMHCNAVIRDPTHSPKLDSILLNSSQLSNPLIKHLCTSACYQYRIFYCILLYYLP